MPDRDRAVRRFNRGNSFFSGNHTVDEIPGVIFASVQMNLVRLYDRFEQRLRIRIVTPAVGPDPAFCTFERHAAS